MMEEIFLNTLYLAGTLVFAVIAVSMMFVIVFCISGLIVSVLKYIKGRVLRALKQMADMRDNGTCG